MLPFAATVTLRVFLPNSTACQVTVFALLPPCASRQLALLQPAYFSPFALSAPVESLI